jgi:hypothetical protein
VSTPPFFFFWRAPPSGISRAVALNHPIEAQKRPPSRQNPHWWPQLTLMDAAKRYRVDTEKMQKAVAEDFAAKRERKTFVAKKTKAAAAKG